MRLQALAAGFIAVTVGTSSTVVLLLQASQAAGIGQRGFESWLFAATLGSGVVGIALSVRHRQPILIAWSTPGVALLVGSIGGYAWPDALGAFVAAGLATAVVGVTGAFRRLLARVPPSVVMAVLAGVLLPFGLRMMQAIPDAPVLVVGMIAVYLALARLRIRAPVIGAFAFGLVVVLASGELDTAAGLRLELATPVWTWPRFDLETILALGLPLWVLTMTAQNATGVAVLQANGYEPPTDATLVAVGTASAVLAPLGSHALNLAALSAAFVAGPEGGPEPSGRWRAAVAAGVAYLLIAAFAGSAAALFAALPGAFVAALAGLVLLGVLATSLHAALEPAPREPALLALLVAASGVTLLGVGAAFWGLVTGLAAAAFLGRLRAG
ncbi:MAG: Benzoate transport protein [uncultured Solirubrobacteraceae bacterium]|uniref:Benzoate transport protein n=1 Tax=uncultured Solirubrobacteraceae bacterium TaxID=1162706 RepID=A0A6J4T093_9ACTN|nr:MAG: Benzoate transport protein [uncultured Solirubrobacteraceae bacterium]